MSSPGVEYWSLSCGSCFVRVSGEGPRIDLLGNLNTPQNSRTKGLRQGLSFRMSYWWKTKPWNWALLSGMSCRLRRRLRKWALLGGTRSALKVCPGVDRLTEAVISKMGFFALRKAICFEEGQDASAAVHSTSPLHLYTSARLLLATYSW